MKKAGYVILAILFVSFFAFSFVSAADVAQTNGGKLLAWITGIVGGSSNGHFLMISQCQR